MIELKKSQLIHFKLKIVTYCFNIVVIRCLFIVVVRLIE